MKRNIILSSIAVITFAQDGAEQIDNDSFSNLPNNESIFQPDDEDHFTWEDFHIDPVKPLINDPGNTEGEVKSIIEIAEPVEPNSTTEKDSDTINSANEESDKIEKAEENENESVSDSSDLKIDNEKSGNKEVDSSEDQTEKDVIPEIDPLTMPIENDTKIQPTEGSESAGEAEGSDTVISEIKDKESTKPQDPVVTEPEVKSEKSFDENEKDDQENSQKPENENQENNDDAPKEGEGNDNGEGGQTKIDTEGGENTSTETEPGDTEVNNETQNGQGDGDGEGEGEEGEEQGDTSETETEVQVKPTEPVKECGGEGQPICEGVGETVVECGEEGQPKCEVISKPIDVIPDCENSLCPKRCKNGKACKKKRPCINPDKEPGPCKRVCKNPPCNKDTRIVMKPPIKDEVKPLPKRGPQYTLNLITGFVMVCGVFLMALQWNHRGESYAEYEAQRKNEPDTGDAENGQHSDEELAEMHFENGGEQVEKTLQRRDHAKAVMEQQQKIYFKRSNQIKRGSHKQNGHFSAGTRSNVDFESQRGFSASSAAARRMLNSRGFNSAGSDGSSRPGRIPNSANHLQKRLQKSNRQMQEHQHNFALMNRPQTTEAYFQNRRPMATVNEVLSDQSSYHDAPTPKGFQTAVSGNRRSGNNQEHSTSDVYSRNEQLQLTPNGPNQNPIHYENRPAAIRTSNVSAASVPMSKQSRPSPANKQSKRAGIGLIQGQQQIKKGTKKK